MRKKSERTIFISILHLQVFIQTVRSEMWFTAKPRGHEPIYKRSALLLLVLGVLANDHHATLALDNLALLADGFYGRSYFHDAASFFIQSISSCCAR